MEISIGEYVRTRMGTIGKFKYYGDDKENIYFKNDRGTTCVYEKEIVKHSKNIIDLIEEGDYVNGMLAVNIIQFSDEICSCFKQILVNRDINCTLPPLRISENDIKSIVTKEQIKQIEYRIKE